jgi:phosphoserine phosphatase
VVATTNMRSLVGNIVRHAPVDHVIGIRFLTTEDDRLTGRIEGPTYGVEKAAAVRTWAHENDVAIPLSHAYSDHYSDHAFLGLVGRPHPVNAAFRLRRMAKRKGWEGVRFDRARATK